MASTSRRQPVRSATGGKQSRSQPDKDSGRGKSGGSSSAALSAAASKAWETRRAKGWQHPAKVRSLTPKEVAAATGVPLAKVQRVLALAAKRIPASTPEGKGR